MFVGSCNGRKSGDTYRWMIHRYFGNQNGDRVTASTKINSNSFQFTHTVRNLHFLSKNSTLISRENCRFFGVKNLWKCCGFGLFDSWQLWFHEKNCQKKNLGWKTRENVGVLSKLNFWTKIWLFEQCVPTGIWTQPNFSFKNFFRKKNVTKIGQKLIFKKTCVFY